MAANNAVIEKGLLPFVQQVTTLEEVIRVVRKEFDDPDFQRLADRLIVHGPRYSRFPSAFYLELWRPAALQRLEDGGYQCPVPSLRTLGQIMRQVEMGGLSKYPKSQIRFVVPYGQPDNLTLYTKSD